MGKKKSRATETSKGERRSVSKSVTKAVRRDYIEFKHIERMSNQIAAFKKGKNVMVTILNPNTNETNKRFIRVSAKDIWKSNNKYMMKQNTAESV